MIDYMCEYCGGKMFRLSESKLYCPKDCDKLETSLADTKLPPLNHQAFQELQNAVDLVYGGNAKKAQALAKDMLKNGCHALKLNQLRLLLPTAAKIWVHDRKGHTPSKFVVRLKAGCNSKDLPIGIGHLATTIYVVNDGVATVFKGSL